MPPTTRHATSSTPKPMPRRVPTFMFENFIRSRLCDRRIARRIALREHRPGFLVRELEAQPDDPCIRMARSAPGLLTNCTDGASASQSVRGARYVSS